MPKPISISLRVKLVIIFALISIFSASAFILVSVNQLDKQFEQNQKNKFDNLRQDFYFLVQRSSMDMNIFAEQLAPLANEQGEHYRFEQKVSQAFENLELLANIEGLYFYLGNDSRPQLSHGTLASTISLSLAQRSINSGEPQTHVSCEKQCNLLVSTPILYQGQRGSIVLEKSLLDLLMSMSELNGVEVGLLSAFSELSVSKQDYLQNWRLKASLMTNASVTYPIIKKTSELHNIDRVIRKGLLYKEADKLLMIWAVPLADLLNSSNLLLIIDDVTSAMEARNAHMWSTILVSTAAIIAFCSMSFLLFSLPISRVNRLLAQYNNIANRKFDDVRTMIESNKATFPDEVDELYGKTSDLINRLELLDTDIERKTEELQHKTLHDELTGLGNRNLFMNEVDRNILNSQRTTKTWALIFLDLDKFKLVNDTLGHDVGDELLKLVSTRLTETLRKSDVVCRMGGDEFTVILYELKQKTDINVVMDKIFNVMSQPAILNGKQLQVGCSAGVYVCSDEVNAANAIKAADMAMYESKKSGRNCYKLFDQSMAQSAQQNFLIENEFQDALLNNQFEMLLQPIISVKDGQLYAFEALVRWNHPVMGKLLPSNFIPILEESNRIRQLGRWVARESIDIISRFIEHYPNIKMSINLSAKQITDDSFVSIITEECFEKRIKPEQIILEITEGVLIDDISSAKEWMSIVQRRGFLLAIDDFGTGYSSLSYLSGLPFDIVKLDQHFVKQLTQFKSDRDILASVVDMVQKMKRLVIAEGVEDAKQLHYLHEVKCCYAQGYLIQEPISVSEVQSILDQATSPIVWPTLRSMKNVEFIAQQKSK